MIELAIRDLLLSDATIASLVGTRIHAVVLPKNSPYPAITFQLVSDTSDPTLASSGPQQKRLQVDCWAKTYVEAKRLQQAVRTFLDGYTGTLTDGTLVQDCQHDNAIDFFEDSALVYRAMSDYVVHA